MRFLFVLLFSILLNAATGQTKVPEFGQFMTPEKNMMICDFDPEAEAVIIFDKAESTHNDDNNLITKRRLRIKILKEKGIEEGNVSLYYYSKEAFEYIAGINAVVFNKSANGYEETKTLSGNNIYDSKINEYWSEKKFALPDVRVGSIIEYEYTKVSKNYNGLETWYFQTELPTMLSSYHLVILPNHEFAYTVSKSEQLPITVKSNRNDGSTLFEMNNIAALRREPFMDARKDYLQKVEFQLSGYAGHFGGRTRYMTTWAELSKELMAHADFGGQLSRNVSADDILPQAKSIQDPYARMKLIYQHIQKNISTKNIKSLYAKDGVKEVYKNKIGNSTEINLLLINLLKAADLEAYPLLVSERSHGKVREGYPLLEQFNNVFAWVVINDKKYVLDASSQYTPPDIIPLQVVNMKAFIVDRKKFGIVNLEEMNRKFKNKTIISARVDEEGMMRGNVLTRSYDYARLYRKAALQKSKEQLLKDFFTDAHPGIETDSFTVAKEDKDSLPLEQKFNFKMPINASGEYKMLNLNLFTEFQQNPFISDIRFTNVNYGCLQSYETLELISLAEGWEPENLPKDFRMITPDQSITCARFITFTNNNLNVLFRIEFNRSLFDSGEYATLKEFFKKMTNALNEQVVLRKKN